MGGGWLAAQQVEVGADSLEGLRTVEEDLLAIRRAEIAPGSPDPGGQDVQRAKFVDAQGQFQGDRDTGLLQRCRSSRDCFMGRKCCCLIQTGFLKQVLPVVDYLSLCQIGNGPLRVVRDRVTGLP